MHFNMRDHCKLLEDNKDMIKKIKYICLPTIASLVACATPTHWEKSGATWQDFNIDKAQCNAQAFSVPNVTMMGVAIIQNQCLQGKGWYLVEDKR
jgi:hypothetical protein